MKKYKLLFWRKALTNEDDFIPDTNQFVTSAIIAETKESTVETFHIKLTDIGLDSLYGEFDILRKDGFWQTIDIDGAELNFLKLNIIWSLESKLK